MTRAKGPMGRTPSPRVGHPPRPRKSDARQPVVARQETVARILKAGEEIFAKRGFEGATTAEIAERAGVLKATLHYHFRTKQDLYTSVLDRVLDIWSGAMGDISADAEPADALRRYIERKMEYSRELPELTRLWAMEVLTGAPHIQPFLRMRVRRIVNEKSKVVRSWIAAGKMDAIDPPHLFFLIWASTQTYAECASQIEVVLNKKKLDESVYRTGTEAITRLFLKGFGVK
jgi:TetR/AcrR family transcriptional regulator